MKVTTLFEETYTRVQMLAFQAFLVDHLPSYVDVELVDEGHIVLKGDFDDVDIEIDKGKLQLNVSSLYGNTYDRRIDKTWDPTKLSTHDLIPILTILNRSVGIRRIATWLKSTGFIQAKIHQDDFDESQMFKFEKTTDEIKIVVAVSSYLDNGSVTIGANDRSFSFNSKHERFTPTSLKRVQHAIDAIEHDFLATGDAAERFGMSVHEINHLELKKHQ